MTYEWHKWIADALRAEGCKVSEYQGWKDRGRPPSTGEFKPYAGGVHHTGTHTSESNPCPTLKTCVNGRSDLPGPLAHVVIGYDGKCHVIAAGRANHAGESNGNGPLYSGDGNEQMIGFEVDYDGSQKMSSAQYDATVRAAAAVCRHFKKDSTYTRGHKEWSTTGKWDPGGYSMADIREDVGKRLKGSPDGDGGDDEDMGYYFVDVARTGDIALKPGEWAQIAWDDENKDPMGWYTPGNAGVYVGQNGRYLVEARAYFTGLKAAQTNMVGIAIYRVWKDHDPANLGEQWFAVSHEQDGDIRDSMRAHITAWCNVDGKDTGQGLACRVYADGPNSGAKLASARMQIGLIAGGMKT